MRARTSLMVGLLAMSVGCGSAAVSSNENLMKLDREWASHVKEPDRFLSYYAADAMVYPPGMPLVTGSAKIRETWMGMSSTPGFALTFSPTKALAAGDLGYTTGTYSMTMGGTTEAGKYVSVWKKQADGQWKVAEDIFNANASGVPPTQHVMMEASALKWGAAPPSLPAGAKLAVVSGDPSKPGPFAVRAQLPAGYKIMPHWHPGDENVTVLSGTVALGMGDKWDDAALKSISVGGYAALSAEQRHFFLSKTASTIQVHGMGPFAVNYVNPADDPSKAKKITRRRP